jgi:AraC-like DNA-binding protein
MRTALPVTAPEPGSVRDVTPSALTTDARGQPEGRVIACLPPDLLMRLRQAIEPQLELASVTEWHDLEAAWLRAPSSVFVLDPRMVPVDTVPAWARGVPALFYTALYPEAIKRALALSNSMEGGASLALRGHDDTPPQLRALVNATLHTGLSNRLIQLLLPCLSAIPQRGREALIDALRHPARYRTVDALAASAGVSKNRVHIWTQEAGLVPKRLLVAASVAWAFHYLRNRTATLVVISQKLGYPEPRDLARHVRRATGCLPRDLARMDEHTLLGKLQHYLTAPAKALEERDLVVPEPEAP